MGLYMRYYGEHMTFQPVTVPFMSKARTTSRKRLKASCRCSKKAASVAFASTSTRSSISPSRLPVIRRPRLVTHPGGKGHRPPQHLCADHHHHHFPRLCEPGEKAPVSYRTGTTWSPSMMTEYFSARSWICSLPPQMEDKLDDVEEGTGGVAAASCAIFIRPLKRCSDEAEEAD